MPEKPQFAPRLEDYGLIGDCETAALVSREGSIDWLCWPRFDSASCFGALLDTSRAGRWQIRPTDPAARITRRYLPGTMVLETTFETAEGSAVLTDFMPIGATSSSVVRIAQGVRGRVPMRLEISLRFEYGSIVPWVTRLRTGFGIRAIAGPSLVVLRSTIPLEAQEYFHFAEFTVEAGADEVFLLSHGPSHLPPPSTPDPYEALHVTSSFWTDWTNRGAYKDEWSDAVQRSALLERARHLQVFQLQKDVLPGNPRQHLRPRARGPVDRAVQALTRSLDFRKCHNRLRNCRGGNHGQG